MSRRNDLHAENDNKGCEFPTGVLEKLWKSRSHSTRQKSK